MGILDSVKGLLHKNKKQVDQGIDKAAELVDSKLPEEHDDKIAKGSDMAKDLVDKLDGEEEPKPTV